MPDPIMEVEEPGMKLDDGAEEVWDHYREARDYKKQYDRDWHRYFLMYSSRQWDGFQKEWQSTPVINLISSTINTIVPLLTDHMPNMTVIPRQPEYEHISGVLQSLLEWIWEAQEMDVKLPMVMTSALIFGNGFIKVVWDPTLREGLGDIAFVPVDASHVFISPHARNMEEADYVIHAENLPRSRVNLMFPGVLTKDHDGAMAPELSLNRPAISQMNQGGASSARPTVKTNDAPGSLGTVSSDSFEPNTDDLVSVLEQWKRVVGPDGRYTLEQRVVLNEKEAFRRDWPYTRGRIPLVQFVDCPHQWTAWATGEVQQVEKLQIEINRRRGHIMDILNLSAHPIMAVDPASGVGYEDWEIYPGIIIPVEGGPAGVAWIHPPAIPNALFEVNRMDKEDFDIVLGNVDVLQGRRPEGIEAGVAIEMLMEAANVRMRLKVRYMEASIRRLGELSVLMFQSFYDTPRMFAIAGREVGGIEKPLTVDQAVQFMQINQPTGDGMAAQNAIPGLTDATFDVRVGAGSTLPVSRSVQFQKALTLYSMQILDDVAVMKASGIPRWQEELQRSRMYWQAKMMQAAAMQQDQAAAAAGAQQEEEPISDEELEAEAASEAVPDPSMAQE